jgi:hypothetical protein
MTDRSHSFIEHSTPFMVGVAPSVAVESPHSFQRL